MTSLADYSEQIQKLYDAHYELRYSHFRQSENFEKIQAKNAVVSAIENLANSVNADINELLHDPEPETTKVFVRYKEKPVISKFLGSALGKIHEEKLSDSQRLNQVLNILDRIFALPLSSTKEDHVLNEIEGFSRLKSTEINPALTQIVRGIIIEPLIGNLKTKTQENNDEYAHEDSSVLTKKARERDGEGLAALAHTYLANCGQIGYLRIFDELNRNFQVLKEEDFSSEEEELEQNQSIEQLLSVIEVLAEEGSIPQDQGTALQELVFNILDLSFKNLIKAVKNQRMDLMEFLPYLIEASCRVLSEFNNIEAKSEQIKSIADNISQPSIVRDEETANCLFEALSRIKLKDQMASKDLSKELIKLICYEKGDPLNKVYALRFLALNPDIIINGNKGKLINKLINAIDTDLGNLHAQTLLRILSKNDKLQSFIGSKLQAKIKEYFARDCEDRNPSILYNFLSIIAPISQGQGGFLIDIAERSNEYDLLVDEYLYIISALKYQKLLELLKAMPLRKPREFPEVFNTIFKNKENLDRGELNDTTQFSDDYIRELFYKCKILSGATDDMSLYLGSDARRTHDKPLFCYSLKQEPNLNPELIEKFDDLHTCLKISSRRMSTLSSSLYSYQGELLKAKRESETDNKDLKDFYKEFNRGMPSSLILARIEADSNGIKTGFEDLCKSHKMAYSKALGDKKKITRVNDLFRLSLSHMDANAKPELIKLIREGLSSPGGAIKAQAVLALEYLEETRYLPNYILQ